MVQSITNNKKYTRWTYEEDEICREYDGTKQSILLIALKIKKQLGKVRTPASVGRRLCLLGLTKFQEFKLTRIKLRQLKSMWGKYTKKEIHSQLGISYDAIFRYARVLNLELTYQRSDWYTVKDIAKPLGFHMQTLVNMINSGVLKAEVIIRNDGKPTNYKIMREDLKKWVKTYPYEMNGRRVDMVFLVDLLCDGIYHNV